MFTLLWNGLIHLVILRDANSALTGILRRSSDRSLGLSLLLTAGIALLFVLSYIRYARNGGLREGWMHGLGFALLAGLLVDLNQYVLYPIPGSVAAQWFLSGVIEFCLYGLLAGWLYPVDGAPIGYGVQPRFEKRLLGFPSHQTEPEPPRSARTAGSHGHADTTPGSKADCRCSGESG